LVAPDEPQDEFCWEAVPRDPDDPGQIVFAPPPARRLPGRALALIAGLAAAVVVVVVVLVGGGSSPPTPPVTLAADVTTHEPGFRFGLSLSASIDGENVSFTGSGSMNIGPPASGTEQVTIDGRTVNEVLDGSDIYIQSPTSADSWYLVDSRALTRAIGVSSLTQNGNDPAQMLSVLRAGGSVSDEGSATIGGVQTTRYHAVLDLARYAVTAPASERAAAAQDAQWFQRITGSASLAVDVWVDSANLVRQLQLVLPISTKAASGQETLTMSFSDYGPQPAITPPPSSEVTDITGSASANASQSLQQLAG
jgi:hypothetical protein